MKKKIKVILSGALLVVLAFTLCACGGDSSDTDSAENNSSENQSSGDTVVFGTTLGLEGLDPHTTTQAGTRAILFNVFEGLLKSDSDGGVTEAVASSYEVSDDGTTYTFTLRDGIMFSDGTEVTVDDVKYSIERYASYNNDSGDAFATLSEVNIVDDSTVEVIFTEENNELLSAFTLAAIIPESVGDDISTNPVGTGPYKYEDYTEGESLTLSVNEYYWGDEPSIENAEFVFISDSTTAYQMLQAGSIDVLPYLTADQVDSLADGYYAETGTMSYTYQMFLNCDYEPLSNTLVRQAICYAIDRDAINDLTSDGASELIGSNILATMEEYFNEDAATTYTYDPDKAIELLEEAGYEDGFELTIAVPDVNTLYTNTAEMIVEYLSAVGIDVDMELMETEKWYSLYTDGLDDEYQAMILAWDTSGDLSPSAWMSLFTSDSSNNFMHYSNSDYDSLYLEALSASGDEKVSLYNELQQMLADDAASEFLFTPADYVGLVDGLEGYTFYPATVWDLSALYYTD